MVLQGFVHWLAHVSVVLQASINPELSSLSPCPIKCMVVCEAMKSQKGILVLSHDGTLMLLHTRGKPTASLARIGAGALRTRDALLNILPSLRWKGVFHVHQCFPERFRFLVGDGEVVGT